MQVKEREKLQEKIQKEAEDFNTAKTQYDADLQQRLGRISALQEILAEEESKSKSKKK
jgi:hypothetical protein